MITHQVQEGRVADEGFGAVDGVPVPARIGLRDEVQPAGVVAHDGGVRAFIARRNDNGNFVDACAERLLDQDGEHGFLRAIAVGERLHGQGALIASGSSDDGFGDMHKNLQMECLSDILSQ